MGDHVNSRGGRWGVRTIHYDRIRWLGKNYVLQDNLFDRPFITVEESANVPIEELVYLNVKYDGRLDGLRGLFYSYGPNCGDISKNVYFHSINDEWPGPNCVDGVFRWECWVPEEG